MFEIEKIIDGATHPELTLELPCGTATDTEYKAGVAVRMVSGVLTVCSGDVQAEYIVLEKKSTTEATDKVKVYKILPGMVFRAPLSAYSATYVKPGLRVTFASTGDKVTATASAGLGGAVADSAATIAARGALILDTLGAAAAGDKVLCMIGLGSY